MEDNIYMQILDEAYYGKNADLLAIEKKIGEIRMKYRATPNKVNSSKEVSELEELFCKAFGFAECQFTVDMSGLHNACTIPVSITDMGKTDSMITTSASGIKFKKEANAYMFITVTKGLLFSSEYTDGEIVAVIMHEVGHNFQGALAPSMRTTRNINNILLWIFNPISMLFYGPMKGKYTNLVNKLRSDNAGMVNAWYGFKNVVTTIAGIGYTAYSIFSNICLMMNPIGVIPALIKKIPSQVLGSIINFLPLGYRDETVADSFSTAYGYGPELSSAFQKMKRADGGMVSDKIFRDSFVGAYFDLCMLPFKIMSNCFDPHPNTIARLNNQYEMLEKELLKADLKPKMKAQIRKDLKDIGETMDAFLDAEDQGYFFSNALDRAMLDMCGGDIRKGFGKNTPAEFDMIDKMYRNK